MFCPRDYEEIKTQEDLRKHVLCFPCRMKMIDADWILFNGNEIEREWPGYLETILKQVVEDSSEYARKKIERAVRDVKLYIEKGTTGDERKDRMIKHAMRRVQNEAE